MHRRSHRAPRLDSRPPHCLDPGNSGCGGGSGAFGVSPLCASPCAGAADHGCLGERTSVGEREARGSIVLAIAVDRRLGQPSWRVRFLACPRPPPSLLPPAATPLSPPT